MTHSVRLFAILRERAGRDQVEIELPDSATVADAIAAVARLPGLTGLSSGSARMAVNREYALEDQRLAPGDELALIPPVSGGAGPDAGLSRSSDTLSAAIGPEPIDLGALITFVTDERAGGLVTFQGLPRDVPALEYEAYAEMALARMIEILDACASRHGLIRVAAVHRTGSVPAREASIAIAASAPHRGEAFDGAREALDRIKAEAPIWKVEVTPEGDRNRVAGVLPQ